MGAIATMANFAVMRKMEATQTLAVNVILTGKAVSIRSGSRRRTESQEAYCKPQRIGGDYKYNGPSQVQWTISLWDAWLWPPRWHGAWLRVLWLKLHPRLQPDRFPKPPRNRQVRKSSFCLDPFPIRSNQSIALYIHSTAGLWPGQFSRPPKSIGSLCANR
ncbi:hypothetical protein SBV1_730019 [Verrucomicrobia bacterium]|nr:hypothetical protein SBV1_730019 [Verrucomicrobiota bacterium]